MTIPENPKIYHILHWDRLPSVVDDEVLLCHSIMANRQGVGTTIGMGNIKNRRLQWQLPCYPDTSIGEYVPFYFCPRSVMLYLIYRANHPELAYRGGQEPIVHLEFDLFTVIDWADANGHQWAFSLSNAAAYYTQFRADIADLNEINWDAVAANIWSNPEIKEAKQAEFLVRSYVPWNLVSRIGVISAQTGNQVMRAISQAEHKPRIEVCRSWYY